MEGYTPLPAETRSKIVEDEWTFPADLRLVELEHRLEERHQTDLFLADVAVRIDEQARDRPNARSGIGCDRDCG